MPKDTRRSSHAKRAAGATDDPVGSSAKGPTTSSTVRDICVSDSVASMPLLTLLDVVGEHVCLEMARAAPPLRLLLVSC